MVILQPISYSCRERGGERKRCINIEKVGQIFKRKLGNLWNKLKVQEDISIYNHQGSLHPGDLHCVYIQEPFNSPLIPRPQSISSDNDFNTFHPMSIQWWLQNILQPTLILIKLIWTCSHDSRDKDFMGELINGAGLRDGWQLHRD